MLSFLYRLVRAFRQEHGYSPNVVIMNAQHYQRLLENVPEMQNYGSVSRFLMMEVILARRAFTRMLAGLRRHSRDTQPADGSEFDPPRTRCGGRFPRSTARTDPVPVPGQRHFFSIQGFTHADCWGIIRRQKAGAGDLFRQVFDSSEVLRGKRRRH